MPSRNRPTSPEHCSVKRPGAGVEVEGELWCTERGAGGGDEEVRDRWGEVREEDDHDAYGTTGPYGPWEARLDDVAGRAVALPCPSVSQVCRSRCVSGWTGSVAGGEEGVYAYATMLRAYGELEAIVAETGPHSDPAGRRVAVPGGGPPPPRVDTDLSPRGRQGSARLITAGTDAVDVVGTVVGRGLPRSRRSRACSAPARSCLITTRASTGSTCCRERDTGHSCYRTRIVSRSPT